MKETGRFCRSRRVRLMQNSHKRFYYNHKLDINTTEPDSCAAPRALYDAQQSEFKNINTIDIKRKETHGCATPKGV